MTDEDVVWENTIDGGTWGCKVVRTIDNVGELTVWNMETNEVILSEVVGLAYGAIFGPDVDDVAVWQDKILAAVDAQEARSE